jgi:AcrR family transcriptional regulator
MDNVSLRTKRELKRKNENRRFILEVSGKLFIRNGYRNTSMDEIAEEAQFSKATVYRYFDRKLDILTHIVLNSVQEARSEIVRISQEKISAEKRIIELIHYILLYFHEKKNLARILFMERDLIRKFIDVEKGGHFRHYFKKKAVPQSIETIFEDIFDQICGVIKEGISLGEFRKVNPREACFILNSILRGFHFKGFSKVKDYSVERGTELIHDIFLNGIKNSSKEKF